MKKYLLTAISVFAFCVSAHSAVAGSAQVLAAVKKNTKSVKITVYHGSQKLGTVNTRKARKNTKNYAYWGGVLRVKGTVPTKLKLCATGSNLRMTCKIISSKKRKFAIIVK